VADRLFLDANVLFTAAHRPQGKAAFLFQAAMADQAPWQLLSSAYAVEEARRNLAAKFPAAMADWPRLLAQLRIVAQPAAPRVPLALPEKDQPIWAAAHAARVTHLLTGDLKDFGPFMNRPADTGGITIQTVGEYLTALTYGS
jgi:hypothetical protein